MIPVGYMAKLIPASVPEWLAAPSVRDVYSVSSCVNDDVLDVPRWDQNGYGLFNSPEDVRAAAAIKGINLRGTHLFYYEAYELEFDGEIWSPLAPEKAYPTCVRIPLQKCLEGFDVVSDCDGPNSHSPLSCNSIAADVITNEHCLFKTAEEAIAALTGELFKDGEPGPYRIFAVYVVE